MNNKIQDTQNLEQLREDSFMKKLLKKRLNQKGLTLIELLAVIVILAIIAAIAIPAITGLIQTQREKAIVADASAILSGAKLAATSGDCATASNGNITCSQTVLAPYVENIKTTTFTSAGTPAFTGAYQATKDSGGEWTVYYGELTKLPAAKYANLQDGVALESEINGVLD